jgi:hypothetical protein
VVEEVRREQVVIDIPTGHSTMSRRVKAQLAVRRWLANHGTVGKESGEFPDFWLETPETRTAVEIKLVGQQSLLQSKLDDVRHVSSKTRINEKIGVMVVFVASTQTDAMLADTALRQHVLENSIRPVRFEVVVGYEKNLTFEVISRFRPRQISEARPQQTG